MPSSWYRCSIAPRPSGGRVWCRGPAASRCGSGVPATDPLRSALVQSARRVQALIEKGSDYYASDRSDFLDWVGGEFERVLDVGCGAGANASWYRDHGASEIVGVWHSHTHTDAYPSPTDVRQAVDPTWWYVIVSLRDDAPVLRAYLIVDGTITEGRVALVGG